MRLKKEIINHSGERCVLVPLSDYNKLIQDQNLLDRLYINGVDSWEGYSECIQEENENET